MFQEGGWNCWPLRCWPTAFRKRGITKLEVLHWTITALASSFLFFVPGWFVYENGFSAGTFIPLLAPLPLYPFMVFQVWYV